MSANSNGAAGVASKLYIVDDDLTEIPMSLRKGLYILTHKFKRAQEASLIELTQSIVRNVTTVQKAKEVFTYEEDQAYAQHYFTIIGEVTIEDMKASEAAIANYAKEQGKKIGELTPEELDSVRAVTNLKPEEIATLKFEQRAEAVRKLYQSDYEIEPQSTGFSFIYEGSEEMVIKQTIGDPENPSFIVWHKWETPIQSLRTKYRLDSNKIEIDRRDKKPQRNTIIDIKPGIKVHDACFRSATNIGFVSEAAGGSRENPIAFDPNNASHRVHFNNYFNARWKAELADIVVEQANKDAQD